MWATSPTHLALLDLITLVTFKEEVQITKPHYVIIPNLLSLPLSYNKIFSSALCTLVTRHDLIFRFFCIYF